MSISQKIDELRVYVEPGGHETLRDLEELINPYDPIIQAKHLSEVLFEDLSDETIHNLLDELETSTARYSRPDPQRFHSFKTDISRYFSNCHTFVDKDMRVAVMEYLKLFDKVFGEPKKICGLPRFSCHDSNCLANIPEPDMAFCPECGNYRALCKNKPTRNGRCSRVIIHGGMNISGPLNGMLKRENFGRVSIYEQSLSGELQRMYVEAVTDRNYLSVAPEMGALSSRMGELMSQIGDTDYLNVAASARQAVRRMRKALAEEDYFSVVDAASELDDLMTGVADDKRRWDEIASLTGRIGRLSETERKRLIEEQKMITIQEMYLLQQETLGNIRDAVGIVASEIMKAIKGKRNIKEKDVRQLFLSTLHGIMKGNISVDYYLPSGSDEDTVIIDGDDA
jgi:hypothetical protein